MLCPVIFLIAACLGFGHCAPAQEPMPLKMTASMPSRSSIRVAWLPPKDTSQCGNQYVVIVRNATYQHKATVSKPEFILNAINLYSSYLFTVHAVDKKGQPFRSYSALSVTIKTSASLVPMGMTATMLSATSMRLTWKPPTDASKCGDKYLVIVRNATYQHKATVSKPEFVMNNMKIPSTYIFTIHATDKAGMPLDASATLSLTINVNEEPIPMNLTASMPNPSSILFAWKPPKDTSQCGNQYLIIVRNATYQDKATVTKPEYVLPNINIYSSYIITIHATDKKGQPFRSYSSLSVTIKTNGKLSLSFIPYCIITNAISSSS
ncbi:unnamed protein product [Dibothriocephalus latus]|uniref:Fibronectin type-III domain-containing protein n=1 Tax=Dibothriocephalus latus TaxID=60516 RepID=A0A3P7LTQ8_DIBLA|nr:unnamed protein product [Dibothriocephalus latus]